MQSGAAGFISRRRTTLRPMNEVQPSRWAWIVLLTVAALIVPALVGIVLFDQARVPMLGIYVD